MDQASDVVALTEFAGIRHIPGVAHEQRYLVLNQSYPNLESWSRFYQRQLPFRDYQDNFALEFRCEPKVMSITDPD